VLHLFGAQRPGDAAGEHFSAFLFLTGTDPSPLWCFPIYLLPLNSFRRSAGIAAIGSDRAFAFLGAAQSWKLFGKEVNRLNVWKQLDFSQAKPDTIWFLRHDSFHGHGSL
jgi:hypothetical protein